MAEVVPQAEPALENATSKHSSASRSLFRQRKSARRRSLIEIILLSADDIDESSVGGAWNVRSEDNSEEKDSLLAMEIKALEVKAASHTPDCGFPNEPQHLSRKFSEMLERHYQLGVLRPDGLKEQHPLSVELGWHAFPVYGRAKTPEILSQCGVGISFYFKLLKALICIFAVMNALTLPSLVMYRALDVTQPSDAAFFNEFKTLQALSYTTIGALGQPIASCRDVREGDQLAFQCPGEGVMRSVVAYFGQPRGSCSCPGPQQQGANGKCAGKISSTGLVDLRTDRSACSLDGAGSPLPCFLGKTRFDLPCCSARKDQRRGVGDLSDLSIGHNFGCTSLTAPFVARAQCEGRASCSFNISAAHQYEIPLSFMRAANSSYTCISVSDGKCTTSLAHNAHFDSCDSAEPKHMVFEAVCVEKSKTMNGSVVSHESIIHATMYLDAASVVVFLLGVWWIRVQQVREDELNSKSICRASQYTLSCDAIPPHAGFSELRKHFIDFFESRLRASGVDLSESPRIVADVNFSSSHYQYLHKAVDRGELAKAIDRQIVCFCERIHLGLFNALSMQDMLFLNKLKIRLHQVHVLNDECARLQAIASENVNRAYITFATEEAYLRCFEEFGSNAAVVRDAGNEESKPIVVHRVADPSEIRWENIGVPWWERVLRIALTSFLIAILLLISYMAIFEAGYVASKRAIKIGTNQCGTYAISLSTDPTAMRSADMNTITYEKVLWDHDWQHYNQTNCGSNGFVFCFCKEVYFQRGSFEMQKYLFYNAATQRMEPWCRELKDSYSLVSMSEYFITFVIIVVNVTIRQFLEVFVQFEQFENATHETLSFSLKIFFGQYINTGLLSLLIYGNIDRLNGVGVAVSDGDYFSLAVFAGRNSDFDSAWYSSVGVSLLLTMWLYTFGTQFRTCMRITKSFVRRLWDTRTGSLFPVFSESVTHCNLQEDLNELYRGPEIQFEVQYASIVVLIFVCMTYSATMPMMNLIALVSLVLLFAFNKFLLLRAYRKPPTYSKYLPLIVSFLLLVAALIHCCVAVWQYTNSGFYSANVLSTMSTVLAPTSAGLRSLYTFEHSWNGKVNIRERLNNESVFVFFALIGVLFVYFSWKLFYAVVVHVIGLKLILKYIPEVVIDYLFPSYLSKLMPPKVDNPPYFDSLSLTTLQHTLSLNACHSDVIEQYKQRLSAITSRGGSSKVYRKQLVGLESYDINNSSKYTHKFGFKSEYLGLLKPTDYLLEKRSMPTVRRRSTGHKVATRRNGVVGQLAGVSEIAYEARSKFESDSHASQVKALLDHCSPSKDDLGRWVRKPFVFCGDSEFDAILSGINVEEAAEENHVQC